MKSNISIARPAQLLTITMAFVMLMLSACGTPAPVTMTATISSPDAATPLTVSKAIGIVGRVSGVGLKSVDVYVDGAKFNSVDTPGQNNEFAVNVSWTPDKIGAHVVQLKGLDDKGVVLVTSDAVFVTVVAGGSTAVPAAITATPAPTVVPTTSPVAPGSVITTTQTTATAIAPASSGGPTVSVKEGDYVNVRSGPATGFDKIGTLDRGQSIAIKGKNADGTWWQISFPTAPGGLGWVFGAVVTTVGNTGNIPTVASPPTPTAAPTDVVVATANPPTPVPAPTSNMPPSALLPYSQSMRFSPRDDIGDVPLGYNGSGKTTNLIWEVNGAKSLELEITAAAGSGIFQNCPAGDLGSVSPGDATNRRIPLPVPSGTYPLTINNKGYYLVKIYVVKADGTTTFIPRNVIVDCYKTQ